ncbi:DNA-directed RNA polymerase subunit delta [Mycoplasmopsis bovis]|uniref:HTH HARE-type domain-containing protein n=1 Tax=Mycoplasmopsis bovis (strain ATCC 25523 / DSM 22781 / NCTC 10131 / PG45) TaxID=289397 RepID=A0A454APM5_MYCBG|nr:hypothetical protein [Mycoplasmopsis bovis]ADR25026.1 conserved hypothetical protein [Mycoplasmopsis bovis PG45]AXJ68213.1 hypothetical protein CH319_00430 [Mycoplasmopsis bovis]AXJ73877.1 hypothetical protein CH315_00430 [Mycoplasmopsis bovis]MBT1322680.1 hypothetical protein [Mycoplasmopsis bovis]MBT1323282.1 hypothetical protein [Mycoplasmopsis bovis]
MKTMLDVAIEFLLEKSGGSQYMEFNTIFDEVEAQLKSKWEKEATQKELEYSKIRQNKIGELYRLLTVDSRFERNNQGLWITREGFE